MLVIKVWGLPPSEEESGVHALCQDMVQTAVNIKTFGLRHEDVVCFFPRDRLTSGLGEEIFIEITCLFSTAGKTVREERHQLPEDIGRVVRKHIPTTDKIVSVLPHEDGQALWIWSR